MVDERIVSELRSNDIIMESFHDMMIAQEGKDKIKYIDAVTEAFGNPTKQANLLNKLFKEVQKIEEIDFGKIPDSKGDLTKYVYYNQMYQCIEVLNNLVEDHPTPNLTSMNKLHQILLSARPDFTFGYRTDNFVIISTYNLMVTTLYEMINVCIVDATEYLRAKLSMSTPTAKQMRWVAKTANQYIKMYENGQWSTLMKTFKSNGNSIMVANEADTDDARVNLIDSAVGLVGKLKGASTKVIDGFKNIPGSAKVVVILITLFVILRKAIYYFITGAGKLSDRLKNNIAILKASTSAESAPTALEKQKWMLTKMENLSDTIDYKIVKSEKAAEVEMKKADREEFNPQEINNISGSDFEF